MNGGEEQDSLWYWMTSPLQSGRVLSAYAMGGPDAALREAARGEQAPIESVKSSVANIAAGTLGTTPEMVRASAEEALYNTGQTIANVGEGLNKASGQFADNPGGIGDFLKTYAYAILGGAVLIGLVWAYSRK